MRRTILVVDDSAMLRVSVRFALENAAFDVVEAQHGKDGLDVLGTMKSEGARPALILTDINMPIMNGIEFIQEVKKTWARFVPILVLTTESQEEMMTLGRQAGATGWLVKPFREQELISVVRKFVR